jgi:arsenate reductase (thioredoxin)
MTPSDELRELFARLSELAHDETLSEEDATIIVAGLVGVMQTMRNSPGWLRVLARTGTPPTTLLRHGLAWPEDAGTRPAAPAPPVPHPRQGETGALPGRPEVLFVCVHDAGRSQMAAALLDRHAAGRVVVRSAGSRPARAIIPAVTSVMAEIGIDLSGARPTPLTARAVQDSDVVITMGRGDACPFYPGKRYLDWQVEDPAGKDAATVRRIRDDIDARVRGLLAELFPAVRR